MVGSSPKAKPWGPPRSPPPALQPLLSVLDTYLYSRSCNSLKSNAVWRVTVSGCPIECRRLKLSPIVIVCFPGGASTVMLLLSEDDPTWARFSDKLFGGNTLAPFLFSTDPETFPNPSALPVNAWAMLPNTLGFPMPPGAPTGLGPSFWLAAIFFACCCAFNSRFSRSAISAGFIVFGLSVTSLTRARANSADVGLLLLLLAAGDCRSPPCCCCSD